MGKHILDKLRIKLADIDGETLVETLVSTLIMALVMLMLCTAIVSAAKINSSAENTNTTFNQAAEEDSGEEVQPIGVTVNIVHGDKSSTSVSVSGKTQNGYIYYAATSN